MDVVSWIARLKFSQSSTNMAECEGKQLSGLITERISIRISILVYQFFSTLAAIFSSSSCNQFSQR